MHEDSEESVERADGVERARSERTVRDRLHAVLADVDCPVHDPLEVAATVDAPHSTRVVVADRRFTAMELAVELEAYQDFPYETVDALVDDVLHGLREEELL